MKTYYIYKFTNKINNMIYIGQSINPEKRYKEHLHGRNVKDTYFDKTFKKYGIENFDFEVIDSTSSQEEVDELEKKYIIKFNSLKPNGYNILKGGREQQGSWNSKEIDEYDLKGNYINTYESASYYEEYVNINYKHEGITRSCRKHTKYKNKVFRYKGDKEKLIYEKPKSTKKIKIYQYDLDGNYINEFDSIKEASSKTNSSRTSIIGCLNGYYKTANNYIWSKNKDIEIKDNIKVRVNTILYKCDENKKIIKKYYNSREAEIDNNFKYNSYKLILRYLDTNKMYNGYYWYRVKFYEENIVPSLNEN